MWILFKSELLSHGMVKKCVLDVSSSFNVFFVLMCLLLINFFNTDQSWELAWPLVRILRQMKKIFPFRSGNDTYTIYASRNLLWTSTPFFTQTHSYRSTFFTLSPLVMIAKKVCSSYIPGTDWAIYPSFLLICIG